MSVQHKSRRSGWLILSVSCFFIAVFFGGCADTETEDARQNSLKESAPEDHGAEPGEEDLEEDETLSDRGEHCETHRYLLSPGKSDTFTFEVHLFKSQGREVVPEDLDLQNNLWEDIGLTASLGYCRVEDFAAASHLWVVDGRDYYHDTLSRKKRLSDSTIGDMNVRWGPDGYGTITQVGRYRNAAAVGELSEESMAELLGGSTTIGYTDPETQNIYSWSVESKIAESDVKILVIELSVDTPVEAKGTGVKSLEVRGGDDSWTLSAQYSNLLDVFIFSGPGESRDCFKESEL